MQEIAARIKNRALELLAAGTVSRVLGWEKVCLLYTSSPRCQEEFNMEYRVERDSMGEMKVPADRYWGAQTQRSTQNFVIGGEIMPREITPAFGILKKAAAIANNSIKPDRMDDKRLGAICKACDEDVYKRQGSPY